MKVSIFIPALVNHAHYLPALIEAYRRGTAVPEQIVVLVSNVGSVRARSDDLMRLENGRVKVELHQERVFAGPARQAAQRLCNGDIIIYQDADDLPHRQRVQVVKHFFTIMDVNMVNHSYRAINDPDTDIDLDQVVGHYSSELYDNYFPGGAVERCREFTRCFGGGMTFPVHAGACCVRREVLDEVKWKAPDELRFAPPPLHKSEDYEFCMEVWHRWNRGVIINAPVYYYRR